MRPSRMYYLAVALPLFAAGTAGAQSTLDAPETVSVVFAVVFAGQRRTWRDLAVVEGAG